MELFCAWFMDHYLAYAPSCRPLLLLLMGMPRTTVQKWLRWLLHRRWSFLLYLPILHIYPATRTKLLLSLEVSVETSSSGIHCKEPSLYIFSWLFAETWYGVACPWKMCLLDLGCVGYTLSTGCHLTYQRSSILHLNQRHFFRFLDWNTSPYIVLCGLMLVFQNPSLPQLALRSFWHLLSAVVLHSVILLTVPLNAVWHVHVRILLCMIGLSWLLKLLPSCAYTSKQVGNKAAKVFR